MGSCVKIDKLSIYGLRKRDIRTFAECGLGSDFEVHASLSETTLHFYVIFCFEHVYFSTNSLCNCKVPSLDRLRRLIRDNNLRKCPNVPFRELRAIYSGGSKNLTEFVQTTIFPTYPKWLGRKAASGMHRTLCK